jgi:proline iminopeptidase
MEPSNVGDGHVLYWETVGSPAVTPAVYLHGGPGSGCTPGARRNFRPERLPSLYSSTSAAVGRSRPLASDPGIDLMTNTTDHLVADLEQAA